MSELKEMLLKLNLIVEEFILPKLAGIDLCYLSIPIYLKMNSHFIFHRVHNLLTNLCRGMFSFLIILYIKYTRKIKGKNLISNGRGTNWLITIWPLKFQLFKKSLLRFDQLSSNETSFLTTWFIYFLSNFAKKKKKLSKILSNNTMMIWPLKDQLSQRSAWK